MGIKIEGDQNPLKNTEIEGDPFTLLSRCTIRSWKVYAFLPIWKKEILPFSLQRQHLRMEDMCLKKQQS